MYLHKGFWPGRVQWTPHKLVKLTAMQAVLAVAKEHTVRERNLVCKLLKVSPRLFKPVGSLWEDELDLDLRHTDQYEAWVASDVCQYEMEFLCFELLDLPRQSLKFFALYDYNNQTHGTLMVLETFSMALVSLLSMLRFQALAVNGESWFRLDPDSKYRADEGESRVDSAEYHTAETDTCQDLSHMVARAAAMAPEERHFELVLRGVATWLGYGEHHSAVYEGLTRLVPWFIKGTKNKESASNMATLCSVAIKVLCQDPITPLTHEERQTLKSHQKFIELTAQQRELYDLCVSPEGTIHNLQVLVLDLVSGEISLNAIARIFSAFFHLAQKAVPWPTSFQPFSDLPPVPPAGWLQATGLAWETWVGCCRLLQLYVCNPTKEWDGQTAVLPHLVSHAGSQISPFLRWLLLSEHVVRVSDLREKLEPEAKRRRVSPPDSSGFHSPEIGYEPTRWQI